VERRPRPDFDAVRDAMRQRDEQMPETEEPAAPEDERDDQEADEE